MTIHNVSVRRDGRHPSDFLRQLKTKRKHIRNVQREITVDFLCKKTGFHECSSIFGNGKSKFTIIQTKLDLEKHRDDLQSLFDEYKDFEFRACFRIRRGTKRVARKRGVKKAYIRILNDNENASITCCVHCDGEKGQLQEFILAQMHSLNNVTTIVEDSLDIFCVDGAREMRITVVFAIAGRCTDALLGHKKEHRIKISVRILCMIEI